MARRGGVAWVKFCWVYAACLSEPLPHYSQPSRENATPSSSTTPLASYKEVLPPPEVKHGSLQNPINGSKKKKEPFRSLSLGVCTSGRVHNGVNVVYID